MSETDRVLDELERRVGPVPLALRVWWENVGEVWLIGAFPDCHASRLGLPMTDPLMVTSPWDVLLEMDEWEQLDDEDRWRAFRAPIAPDIFH